MEPTRTYAIGIELRVVTTADGGRNTPLLGGNTPGVRFQYRPNWGLPGWPDGDQTAAPVLGFSKTGIELGSHVRAIIVPLFSENVPEWHNVTEGDELRMYEGSRICGHGTVAWTQPATWPMPVDEQERLIEWLT